MGAPNMKIAVVTTMNQRLYDEYGHRFLETYNWPFDCFIYHEDRMETVIDQHHYGKDGKTPFFYRDLFRETPQCKKFIDRNSHRQITDKRKDFWKDGVRFCYKVYAYTDFLATYRDYDGVICIDADSVFYKRIDAEWIKKYIHRDDCMMTYLGRPVYTECGFLYFNMNHQYVKLYAEEMARMYTEDLIYKEKQQHDSWIWDVVRLRFEKQHFVKNFNIGDNKNGHVQARSILGPVYDHTKGLRKNTGKSPEART